MNDNLKTLMATDRYQHLLASIDNPTMFRTIAEVLAKQGYPDKVMIAELRKRGRRSDNYNEVRDRFRLKEESGN